MKRKVAVVTGTRPTFIDMAQILKILARDSRCELYHYNTGQHYDELMSKVFFEQLCIPRPTFQSHGIHGNMTQGEQLSKMLVELESEMIKDQPEIVVVKGDTNTALAGALVAAKLHIPIAHVEAGFRNYDDSLPEELNRKLIAQMATWHYTPHRDCTNNLILEGIKQNRIFEFGHPVVDAINLVMDSMRPQFYTNGKKHYLFTIHRDFNVDNEQRLASILRAMDRLANEPGRIIVFPIHPRTQKRVEEFGLDRYLRRLKVTGPLNYSTCLSLERDSFAVITDSGGIQKECVVFGTPMITVRPNLELQFTLKDSVNQLAIVEGQNRILECVRNLELNYPQIQQSAKKMSAELAGVKQSPSEAIAQHISTNILPTSSNVW